MHTLDRGRHQFICFCSQPACFHETPYITLAARAAFDGFPFQAERSDRRIVNTMFKRATNPKDFNQIIEKRIVGTSKLLKGENCRSSSKTLRVHCGRQGPKSSFLCKSTRMVNLFNHRRSSFLTSQGPLRMPLLKCLACFGFLRTSREIYILIST